MIKLLILSLIIVSTAWAQSFQDAKSILQRFSHETKISKRLDAFSVLFLGLPYGDAGPLGEGEDGRYDQDPLYRFDLFDCTTYVETVIGLARSQNLYEFERSMDQIRYENGEVDYLKRNHFPSLQWIPLNVANHILSEINHNITSPDHIKLATAIIDLPGWLKKIKVTEIKIPWATDTEKQELLEELHAKSSQYFPLRANLEYIPIQYILQNPEILRSIPHGSLVNFVRPNWNLVEAIGTHMNVSHQGLLFWKEGVLQLRHASSAGDKKVVELPFLEYLLKFENHPTLKGVHFMRVN